MEIEERKRVKSVELNKIASKWGIYRGHIIEPSKISNWLKQFGDVSTQRDVFNFLSNLRFITRDDIIKELKYAFQLAIESVVYKRETKSSFRHDVYVSYLDGIGKSGSWVANQFKEVNGILKTNLIEMTKLELIANQSDSQSMNMKVLVLVDDFSGTGNTLCEYLVKHQNMLKTLLTESVERILLFVAYGFEDARTMILKKREDLDLDIEIHFGQSFNEDEKVFSNTSRYFASEEERKKVEAILIDHYGTKVDHRRPRGYNDSEIAIVFPENCPNNSLPILWKSAKSWQPLFPRLMG